MDVLGREWLAVLAGLEKEELRIRESSRTSLVWTDAAAYMKHVDAQREALLARYWKLAAVLVGREILTLREARALKPVVTIKVHDMRKNPVTAPPEFPEIPAPPNRPRLPGEEPQGR